jgi:hypothetical protein
MDVCFHAQPPCARLLCSQDADSATMEEQYFDLVSYGQGAPQR